MELRDNYIYRNKKIYQEGKKKPLKFVKLNGCHNNYQLTINGSKINAFLKQSIGASDYADVVSKRLCDELNIKCAECELVNMTDFPQENEEQKMEFDAYVEFCKDHFGITDLNKLKKSYKDYSKKFEGIETKHAILSYDYKCVEPYKSAKIIKLDELVHAYSSITEQDGTFAIESYVNIAKELCDSKSQVGKELRKRLKLKNNIELSQFFDLDLKKIALLGYATCQMDMSSQNMHLALIKTKKGYRLEVAPLFDNGESFNLDSVNHKQISTTDDVEYATTNTSNYGNALTLKETDTRDAESQLVSLAEEIINNPELEKYYDILQWLNIEDLCNKENIGEKGFDAVKHTIVKIYNERISLLQQEIKKQQEKNISTQTIQQPNIKNKKVRTKQVALDKEIINEEEQEL